MAVLSSLQLILPLLVVLIYSIVDASDTHRRRQIPDTKDRGVVQKKFDESVSLNNPSGNNALGSPQTKDSPARSRSFYDSPGYQAPKFAGDKPSGWFDTKYPNWISDQDGKSEKNKASDGRIGAPSSLQAGVVPPKREDGGVAFLKKVARQYASKGEKSYNFGQPESMRARGSVCINHDNFNGYIFGKFPCPLPPGTGMNQLDRFCCGPSVSQYCCNAQEFEQNHLDTMSINRYPKHAQYRPSSNRAAAIVIPIVSVLVGAGAVVIVILYYRKLRNEQSNDRKSLTAARLQDSYAAVPQDLPSDRSMTAEHDQYRSNVHA